MTDVEVCGLPCRAVAAESFFDALLGVHAISPEVEALVILGSSVHGLTLRRALWVVGLDEHGQGFGGRHLRPMTVVRFPGARAVVEFPRGPACDEDHGSHTTRWSG